MVIVEENQENAQVLYIFSIYCTCMFRSLLTFIMVLVVTEFSATSNNCLSLQEYKRFAVLCNNEHPDDGHQWPKQVGAINRENMYYLCILLVFINYTIMQGV